MTLRWLLLIGLCAGLGGCLDDLDVEGQVYPCRRQTDCVEGYVCDPVRYVCVQTGLVSIDAGPLPDTGTTDTGTASDAGPASDADTTDAGMASDTGPETDAG